MRRIAGGHEADLVQAQRLQQLEGGAQVTEMNRVERAAEDADASSC